MFRTKVVGKKQTDIMDSLDPQISVIHPQISEVAGYSLHETY